MARPQKFGSIRQHVLQNFMATERVEDPRSLLVIGLQHVVCYYLYQFGIELLVLLLGASVFHVQARPPRRERSLLTFWAPPQFAYCSWCGWDFLPSLVVFPMPRLLHGQRHRTQDVQPDLIRLI